MKHKYIEHDFPRYFIFGEHEDGRVAVASLLNDCICTCSKEDADRLIEDRNSLVKALCDMASALDELDEHKFNAYWYGRKAQR